LKPRPAAKLKVTDAGGCGGLDRGQDVAEACLAAEHALEPVAERGEHHPDFFF